MAPWIAVLASALAKQQQDQATKQQAAQQLQQQYAAQQGAPSYQMQAAQVDRNLREGQGPNFLKHVLPLFGGDKKK